MRRQDELAELRALHRAVWGDASYERHLAAGPDRRRPNRLASLLLTVATVALAVAVIGVIGVSHSTDRTKTAIPPASLPAPTVPAPAPTAARAVTTTVPDTTTAPETTTARKTTTVQGASSSAEMHTTVASTTSAGAPHALAHTGVGPDPLLALGVLLVVTGLALHRSRGRRE